MIRFDFLDKNEKESFLPRLFELLYSNMNEIEPSGLGFEEDYREWSCAISPALEKAPRKLILIYDGEELIGFFMYYVNETTFMMEEIQLKKEYHGTGIFKKLYAFLFNVIPQTPEFVEAYALKSNLKSQEILAHLGLECVGENLNGSCWHYRGKCREMWQIVLKRGEHD